MVERKARIAGNHAIARQRQTSCEIPIGRFAVRAENVKNAQDSGQPPVWVASTVARLLGHVSDDILGLEAWGELVAAADARDGRELVFEVRLSSN